MIDFSGAGYCLAAVCLMAIMYRWHGGGAWGWRMAPLPVSYSAAVIGYPWLLMAETEEKTEPATPHKKQQARRKGQVAKSSDLNAALVVCAVMATLFALRGYVGSHTMEIFYQVFDLDMVSSLDSQLVAAIYQTLMLASLKVLAPILGAALVFGLLANYMQVGFLMAGEALAPRLDRINPVEGFKRIFSKRALFEMLKTLLKIIIIGAVVYYLGRKEFANFVLVPNMNNSTMMDYFGRTLFRLGITTGMVFLVIAVLDLAYQKWQFNRDQRMSKTELKMEMKQTEGDPLLKSRLRQKQRLMAMRRTMQKVPEATVVITNPTHMAIALRYEDHMEAPEVTAKGAGYMALKIKDTAREHKVPVIEDRPLAHSLYDSTEVGDYIPVELYQAVAVVLAAIYQQKQSRRTQHG